MIKQKNSKFQVNSKVSVGLGEVALFSGDPNTTDSGARSKNQLNPLSHFNIIHLRIQQNLTVLDAPSP